MGYLTVDHLVQGNVEMTTEWFDFLISLLFGTEKQANAKAGLALGVHKSLISLYRTSHSHPPSEKISMMILQKALSEGLHIDMDYDPPVLPEPLLKGATAKQIQDWWREDDRTDEDILECINKDFETLDMYLEGIHMGVYRALIISGPPGIGKSYPITQKVQQWGLDENQFRLAKGTIRPTHLYKNLYETMDEDCLMVLDDADAVWHHEDSLNLLKAALDTTGTRYICYKAESDFLRKYDLPDEFEFNGRVIFLTNLDLPSVANAGNQLSESVKAVLSRCHHISIGSHDFRSMMLRIRDMILRKDMLRSHGIESYAEALEIATFIEQNAEALHNKGELSLRGIVKMVEHVHYAKKRGKGFDWRSMVRL